MRVSELLLAVCVSVCVLQVTHGGGHNDGLHFDCREGWKLYEGVCYKAYNIPMTWDEAAETCVRQGGELFDPAIQEVFLYLKEELPGTFWTRFKVTEENEALLQNINQWAYDEPRAEGGSCVAMNQIKGYWRQDCGKLNNVVCEYDACLSGYVPCALGSKCVNKTSSICNDVWDCEDRSDERNCGSACNTYTLIPADTTSSGFSTNTINDWKDCWWTFEAEVGKLIRLFVPAMNLENSVAHLHILTGSPDVKYSRTVEYETGTIGEHYVYSDNNFLHVRLYAGDLAGPITSQTFTWTTVFDMRAQENVLQASDVYQTLKFPLSSEAFRPQGMTVYWTITAPEGEIISYHIECMLSAGVTSTPVSVIGGSDGAVYPRNTNTFYATSTNMLKVRMEYSESIDSFTLYYMTGCDITITRWAGVIESPGKLEDTIPHELSCEWTLNAGQTRNPPRGMMVEIEKDLAEDPRQGAVDNVIMDTLEVFADDDTNALTADADGYYAAPGGKLSIKFDSDETVHSKYFLASFGVDCEALSLSAETIKSNENAFYGKDVTLSCPDGDQFNLEKYKNESSVTAKCALDGFVLEDGTNVIPECQGVRCGTPPKINNGYIINATSTSYNGNAWYGCHPGFSIEGSSMVTCTQQGSWETPPRCTSSQCSDAGGVLDVTDGGYEIEAGNPLDGGSADFGVIVRFYCDPGFELIGQQRTHCTGNGWTHTVPPTCRRRKCIVPTVTNAETLNTLTVDFESTVEINCKSGYTPSDTQVLTCLQNQTFDKEVTCTNIDECQTDPCDADLQTCTDTDPGFICTCIDGFEADGNNGCQDIQECSVDNGGCSDRCRELPGSYECLCESEGYVLFTEDGLHGHTIPASETGLLPGDLYRYNHTCVKTSCPPLEEVANGVFGSNDWTLLYGDTITLKCEDGYETSGGSDQVELECTSSIGTDTCTARSCTIPPAPQFGTFDKTSVWFKENINLDCVYSNTRNITRTATCIYDNGAMRLGGEDITSCPVIDCGTPALPVGGAYQNGVAPSSTLFLENASFDFTCGVGYDISGASGDSNSSEVKCKSNGRWDFGTLRCNGKRCSDPGTPVDARQIVGTYERGQTLSYECVRDGFAPLLDGQERTYECVYDAATDTVDWSNNLGPGNLPTCTDVTDPVINVCPGNKFYFPMDKVQVDQPGFSDNFGLNVEGRNNYMATGDVILNDEQFTYSASDFEDGETTCSFTFSILDRDAKPALTCPDVETVRVMSSDDGSMDVIDFVTIDNSEGLQLSPSSIQKTVNNIGTSQIARVNVIDVYGRRAECTFMIHFEAGKCFQESLYPDGNAVRSCVETANGLSCNSTCNANYVFNDGTKMKTFDCSNSNQDWNFPDDLDIFCLQAVLDATFGLVQYGLCVHETTLKYRNAYWAIENPAYLADITIEYEFGSLAGGCVNQFNEQINNHLTNFETNIRTQIPTCNGMEWQVTVRTPGTTSSLFKAELQINLQSEAFTSEQKDQCVTDLLADAESVFKVNENRLVCNSELALNVVNNSTSPPQLSCVTSSYHLKNTPDGEQVCVPCGPGYSFDEGSNVCTRCSADQYQNLTNQVECKTCPSASAPDPLRIDCDSTCPAGFNSTDGFYPCTPCPVDQYWVDSKTCLPCPDGKSTTGLKGAKREEECYAQCPVGTYSETGYNVEGCTSCPLGFYQPNEGQQVCLECPTSTTTAAIQTINSNDCIPMDACDSFGCDAEGTQACEHIFHRAVCKCKDGFRGEKCNQKNEICDYIPCTAGSTCQPVAGESNVDFTCSCRTDLDVCNANVNTIDVEAESATQYAAYSLNQEDCQENCTNDVQCVSAVHAVTGTSEFCLLFDSTINTKPLESGDSSVYMVKECVTAFSGDRCEKDTFPDCDSADCASGSMCMDKVNGFECLCPTEGGFSGPKCAQAVDVCSPNPCENGGACTAHGTVRFECTCVDGYTGETCETLIDQCTMNPGVCLFGGDCIRRVNDYQCSCDPEFDGSYCQNVPDFCTVKSDCLGNPCISNTDEREGYCFCNSPLFERNTSDDSVCIKVNEPCDLFTCENEGTCVNSDDGLTASCSCPPEFTGHKCQHNVDDCTETACENGGTCNDMVGDFDCTCAPGYDGETCDNDIDDCAGESCGNGVCMDGVDTFTCDCTPGYTGTECEIDINECLSFPCQHDGTCEPGLDSYTCTCPPGWTGNNCESAVDKCSGADNKCENDGKCFTILESSICRCEGGTLGEFCQNARDICDIMSDADLCQNNGACQNKEGTAVCICDIEYSVDRCYFTAGLEDRSGGNVYYNNSSPFTSAEDCKEQCLQQRECAGVTHVGTFCLFYKLLDIATQFEEGAVYYNRVCPTDYSGDSCECIKDWCADETICQNGGTCSPVSPKGFKCDCQDGYSGVVCEVAADPCAASPCGTSGATCTSTVTDYVCQCPQGNVFNGTACKAPESNFNLLVDNLKYDVKTPTELAAPFRLESRAVSVMMWVRVFDFKDKAVLLELSRSTCLDINNRYFSLTLSQSSPGDDGGIQTEIGEDSPQYLPHETNVYDGEWHHIGVAIDEDGQLSSTIDARTNSMSLNIGQGLQSNDNGWLRLGESVIAEYRDITVWNTYLTPEDFSLAFADQMPSGAPVQGWWNYVLPRSTSLLRSDRATSPVLDSDMLPPVLNCSEVDSPVNHVLADRFVSLDNIVDFQQNLEKITQYNPGLTIEHNLPSELPWGWKAGIVVGMNANGYCQCRFPVYVKYNAQCPAPIKLSDDVLYTACNSGDGICSVSCSDNNEGLAGRLPRYVPCSGVGVYDIEAPYDDTILPACNPKASTKYVITAKMQFEFVIDCANLAESLPTEVEEVIMESFTNLNTNKWINICSPDCSNIEITTAQCSSDSSTPKRFVLEFEVQLDNNYLTYTGGGNVPAEDAIRMIVKLDEDLTLKNFASGKLLQNTVEIVSSESCTTPGSVMIYETNPTDPSTPNKVCVPCGPGSFYRWEAGMGSDCDACPKGYYQDELGQMMCKECGIGANGNPRTTYQMGATSETQCVEVCSRGQYYKEETSSCTDCPRHYYQDEEGQNYCKSCAIGFKTARVGSNSTTECKEDCPAGQYRDAQTAQCLDCQRGFWRSLDLDDCRECPQSMNSNQYGTTTMLGELGTTISSCNMDKCPQGTYWNTTQKSCVDCGVGYYQTEEAALMCEKCPKNYTTEETASTVVADCKFYCAAGYEVKEAEVDACKPCQRGTYKDNDGMSKFDACQSCPSDTTMDFIGATSEDDCTVPVCTKGQIIKEGVCSDCPPDTYSDVEIPFTNTECVNCTDTCDTCEDLLGTDTSGAKDESECTLYCDVGEEVEQGNCVPCSRGYFKDNRNDTSRFGMCEQCPDSGFTTDESGSTSSDKCDVPVCTKGQIIVEGACTNCPRDTYSDVDLPFTDTMCVDCTGECDTCDFLYGTNKTGAADLSECITYCGVGEELIGGECMACKRGYFKDNRNDISRFGMCEQCPDSGFTTDETGSISADNCSVPVCDSGDYVDGNECKPCAENSYQPIEIPFSDTICTPCEPIGDVPTGTRSDGAFSSTDCLPICDAGKQFDDESNLCTDCPVGTYKEASKKFDRCQACPSTHTTAGTGAAAEADCNIRNCQPGTFINASDECEPCPVGQYQDQPRKTACIPCGDELSTTGTGSNSSDLCQTFCNPGNQGISVDGAPKTCTKCPEHFYKSEAGLAPCVECPANYTSNDERTACPDLFCYYGYQYVPAGVGVAETCEMCAEGFYKDTKGNDVQCTECDPGWTTDGAGQRECPVRHCVAGSYFNVDIDNCSLCGIGTYKPDAGNMMCTACDSDKTTAGTGSTLATQCDISICPVGQYRDPQEKDCTVCPLNTYQDQIGETTCTDCGNGEITLATESTSSTDCVPECQRGEQYVPSSKSCTPCPDGTYKDTVGNALDACQACPSDKTTVGTGSTAASDCSQTVCSIGTYGDVTTGTVVCKPCAIGTYSSQRGLKACTQCTGTTTLSVASDSIADCVEICTDGNGYVETSARCEPCVIGLFNDLSGSEPNKCKACPDGKTNVRSGSRSCPNNKPTPTVTTGLINAVTVLTFQVSIDNCNIDFNIIILEIRNTARGHFKSVQQNQFPRSTICLGPNCSNIGFAIVVNTCRALKRRRRREVNHKLEVEITFSNVSKNLIDNTDSQYPFEDVLNRILTTDNKELSPSADNIELDSFQAPVITPVCLAGERVASSVCEQCPPGTYGADGNCIDCAADTYQNWNGSTSCKDCPENTFSDGLGSASIDACQSYCVAQPLYCNNHGTCYVTGRRSARCECFEDYKGDTCSSKTEPTSNMPVILGAAIGGGGALLIIVLIVVGVYRYLSSKEENRKRNKYSPDNDGFVSPLYDRNPYDNFTLTSGSNQPRPFAPYPSVGYPALGYRPDTSFEEPAYQTVYKLRPDSRDEDTFVWQA